jgi:competence protein ComEC
VGQGDACVIESPTGRVVVVDAGGQPGSNERSGSDPGARVVVPFLRSRGVNTVDLLVATHPHDDHVQGLIAVVDRLRAREALDGGFPHPPSETYRRYRERLRRRGVPVAVARRGLTIDCG